MTVDFARVNGYRLRYRLEGEGDLAVFGHGLLGSIEQVDDGHAALADLHARIRLLLYDARGHGQSEGPADSAGYSWETLGADMAAFPGLFGEERAIFGGGSMGAGAALWVALERPELVRALVLVMPPPLGHHTMREDAERQAVTVLDLLAAAVENYGLEATAELARQLPGFATDPAEVEQRVRWLRAQNPLALTYAIRGLRNAPFHDPACYRRIEAPTLVLAHEGDGLHPARAAGLLGATIPRAEVYIAPDPGYWRAHPAEFLGHITRFLDQLAG